MMTQDSTHSWIIYSITMNICYFYDVQVTTDLWLFMPSIYTTLTVVDHSSTGPMEFKKRQLTNVYGFCLLTSPV